MSVMGQELIEVQADKHLVRYKAMCTAIAVCDGLDECKDIINKSVAMAAYYKQVKDEETELMFHRVKLRAWRRIGELLAVVDVSDCDTMIAKAKKVRAAFEGDPTVADLSDFRITELLKLMTISDESFEYALDQRITGTMPDLFRRTPEEEAAMQEARQKWEDARKQPPPKPVLFEPPILTAEEVEEAMRRQREEKILERHEEELAKAADEAMDEVGITLERKDRAHMKSVVFLIKEEVHAVMRQAAFDQKVTMQEVLRRGLRMWLVAHDYDWPDEPAPPPSRRRRGDEARV